MTDQKLDSIRIVTRCTTRDQFTAMFRRFCKPTSLFIPSRDTRPIGVALKFSVRLSDDTMLLRGEGVVLDVWTTSDNPFKRPGIQLGIHRLDDSCTPLFEQLLLPRTDAMMPLSPRIQLGMLFARSPEPTAEIETPTVEMAPLVPPVETRTPGAPDILPANPLMEMDDALVAAFVDCMLAADDVPQPIEADTTVPNPITTPTPVAKPTTSRRMWTRDTIPEPMRVSNRDIIATLLGMQPLKLSIAAPTLVVTEGVDRVRTLSDLVPPAAAAPPDEDPFPPVASRFGRWWIPATVAALAGLVAFIAT